MTRWLGFPLTLDLTYRYVDAGKVRGSAAPYDPGNIPREAFSVPVRASIVTVGLRMPIGWSGGGRGFSFSPSRNFVLPQARNGGGRYLAICSSLGTRYYHVPGTDTCLAVGGSVRYETAYLRPLRRTDDTTGMTARATVTLDARTPTAYGPVQTYLRGEFISASGVFSAVPGVSVIANLDRAFIRFGGLVVGQLQSMFDFYTNKLNFSSIGGSDLLSQQISYAIDLGGSFVAGIGIESNAMRTRPALTDYFFSRRPPIINLSAGTTIERTPNVVAALRYDGSGFISAAQLSAAIGEVRTATAVAPNLTARATGFAVQAGVRLTLPFFAARDSLWLQGAYAQGSMSYLGADRIPTSLGNLVLPQADATIVQGKMVLTKGYSLTAAFVHSWTPSISQAVYGSIVSLDYPTLAQAAGIYDTKILQAGTSLVWSPTPGFQLGGEIMYTRLDPQGSVVGVTGLAKNYVDQVSVRLRALREF
ncbi:MAG: porin [Hyphomicrobiales bacterium]|nr:porin [Hyphomicrobiales bacterium]